MLLQQPFSYALLQVWWHLPLLALGFAGFAVAVALASSWLRSRRAQKAQRLMEELYRELWDAWTTGTTAVFDRMWMWR